MEELVEFDLHSREIAILPVIGVMKTGQLGMKYKCRLVFWWLFWQISIGIWANRR